MRIALRHDRLAFGARRARIIYKMAAAKNGRASRRLAHYDDILAFRRAARVIYRH